MGQYDEIFNLAKEASKNSYSPYSNFPVGACVVFESGEKYPGANIENASYGLSLCAERNAISSALAQGERSKIKAVAIYSPRQKFCVPCGACLQWMSEFKGENVTIILENDNGEPEKLLLSDFLPYGFKFQERDP